MSFALPPGETVGKSTPPRTTTQLTYVFSLPVFEGPLDLLLHLIEREQLDITAVSLVQVTDQYLTYVETLKQTDVDTLADFLVMAARLLLIKSQALLPRPAALPGDEDEEDPGEILARQLREYRRFKAVAHQLGVRESGGMQSFVRLAPPPKVQTRLDLNGISVDDLLEAVRQALAIVPQAPPVDGVVRPLTVTVSEKANLIVQRISDGRLTSFSSLLEDVRSRLEIIVTLLAVLELVKRGAIHVFQEQLFGEITIEVGHTPARSPDVPPLFTDEDFTAG